MSRKNKIRIITKSNRQIKKISENFYGIYYITIFSDLYFSFESPYDLESNIVVHDRNPFIAVLKIKNHFHESNKDSLLLIIRNHH